MHAAYDIIVIFFCEKNRKKYDRTKYGIRHSAGDRKRRFEMDLCLGVSRRKELFTALEKDSAFISGPFLLECIVGGPEEGVIDVFVPWKNIGDGQNLHAWGCLKVPNFRARPVSRWNDVLAVRFHTCP